MFWCQFGVKYPTKSFCLIKIHKLMFKIQRVAKGLINITAADSRYSWNPGQDQYCLTLQNRSDIQSKGVQDIHSKNCRLSTGEDSDMKQSGMPVGTFELWPLKETTRGDVQAFMTRKREHYSSPISLDGQRSRMAIFMSSRTTVSETLTAKNVGVLSATP